MKMLNKELKEDLNLDKENNNLNKIIYLKLI